jgi:hypothetical protein
MTEEGENPGNPGGKQGKSIQGALKNQILCLDGLHDDHRQIPEQGR